VTKAEEYRANAAECDKRAAVARDREVKAQFEELARQWRMMAEQAERMLR
jgi:hypothetical protein